MGVELAGPDGADLFRVGEVGLDFLEVVGADAAELQAFHGAEVGFSNPTGEDFVEERRGALIFAGGAEDFLDHIPRGHFLRIEFALHILGARQRGNGHDFAGLWADGAEFPADREDMLGQAAEEALLADITGHDVAFDQEVALLRDPSAAELGVFVIAEDGIACGHLALLPAGGADIDEAELQLARGLFHDALGVFGRGRRSVDLFLHIDGNTRRSFEEHDLPEGECVLGIRRAFFHLGLHFHRINLIGAEFRADHLVALHMAKRGAEDAVVVQGKIRHAGRAEHIDAGPNAHRFAQGIGERLLAGGLHVARRAAFGFDGGGGCKVRSQKEEG